MIGFITMRNLIAGGISISESDRLSRTHGRPTVTNARLPAGSERHDQRVTSTNASLYIIALFYSNLINASVFGAEAHSHVRAQGSNHGVRATVVFVHRDATTVLGPQSCAW